MAWGWGEEIGGEDKKAVVAWGEERDSEGDRWGGGAKEWWGRGKKMQKGGGNTAVLALNECTVTYFLHRNPTSYNNV